MLIDVTDNTRKIVPIRISKDRKISEPINKGDEKQLRSVVGSLSWIARQGRPDIIYRVSKLQSSVKNATVGTLQERHKVLNLAMQGKDLKLRYRNGAFDFQNLGVLTVSDASFANEPGHKSQQGRIHFLVPAEQLAEQDRLTYDAMVISYASTTIKRVCRATLQAETYALQTAQEHGDRLRALLAKMYNKLDPTRWLESSRENAPHLIFSDCRSLTDHLKAQIPRAVQDKRLQIELMSIRQALVDDDGNRTCDIYPGAGDRVDWINTSTMAADCLTKSMKPTFLVAILVIGKYQIDRTK